MKVTLYGYPKCSTCRDALKSLKAKGLDIQMVDLFETPPTAEQLQHLVELSGLAIKTFFNVQGDVYKELNLKDKIDTLTDEEKLQLLSTNGRLIKRPIVTNGSQVTVGFKEIEYATIWGK